VTKHFNDYDGCVIDLTTPQARIITCYKGGPAIFGSKHRRRASDDEEENEEE
jgi:hypothetical protein